MIVRCINDDWSTVNPHSIATLVLEVGDPMPEKGKEYRVSGYLYIEHECVGYYLEGLDYSNYPGGKLAFSVKRFEKVSDEYEPNHYDPEFGVCEKINMTCIMTFDVPMRKMPRKKKKHFKKYGMHFIHKGK